MLVIIGPATECSGETKNKALPACVDQNARVRDHGKLNAVDSGRDSWRPI